MSLREEGLVVFVNGCFDILHRGHLTMLEYCYNITQQSDRLYIQRGIAHEPSKVVVGVNSDESVKRLKGIDRPIIKEADRVFALKCIEFVNEVHVFNETSPRKLIEKINPSLIIKTYNPKDEKDSDGSILNPAPEETEGYDVRFFPLLEGYSTTIYINEILSNRR